MGIDIRDTADHLYRCLVDPPTWRRLELKLIHTASLKGKKEEITIQVIVMRNRSLVLVNVFMFALQAVCNHRRELNP